LHRNTTQLARKTGEIKTLFGRRRRFNRWTKGFRDYDYAGQIWTDEQMLDKYGSLKLNQWGQLPGGEYRAYVHKALNGLLQGSAADIMKTAMVEIQDSGLLEELGVPHLTVHDELDGSLPDTRAAKQALKELMHIMETCVELEVPLLADLTVAESWGKTKN
jgi:DNA polymerase I-like protein with 3'-5' exonuclease and polymerase domains